MSDCQKDYQEAVDNWFEQQIRSGPADPKQVKNIQQVETRKSQSREDERIGRALTTVNEHDFKPHPAPAPPEAD